MMAMEKGLLIFDRLDGRMYDFNMRIYEWGLVKV